MSDIPGIKPYSFGNPTTKPWVDVNDLRAAIVDEIASRQQTASANKAGAKLRVDRASNKHLEILADLFSGQPQALVRSDLTQGGSLSTHIGGRRIHIPTFNQYTNDVVMAGVRYAPMQSAVWDPATKSTRIVSAQESLVETLQALMQNGIKDLPYNDQARYIAKSLDTWRMRNLQHVRFGPTGAGGALPYYLSHQISIGDAAHPAVKLGHEVERLVGMALQTMHSSKIHGGKVGETGITSSMSYVRQALAHQLALGLVLFEEGSPIKSAGVKALRLRGFNSFGGDRSVGSEGRIVASDLPSHAYGVALPGEQVKKGMHHRRAMMALPSDTVGGIRLHGSKLRGLKKPSVRTTRILMSGFDTAARHAATQGYGQMGVALPGMSAQLDTPIRAMVLRPKAGADLGKAQLALQMLFGDSQVAPSSPEMTQIAGEVNRFRTIRLTHSRVGLGYAEAELHPLLAQALEEKGVGGAVTFDKPIGFEDLGGRLSKGPKGQRVIEQKARVGSPLTSAGVPKKNRTGEISSKFLRPDEEIVGLRSGPGVTQIMVRRKGVMAAQEGAPLLVGTKRVSAGKMLRGFRSVDIVAPEGKLGIDLKKADALTEHILHLIERKGGRKGLREAAEVMGGKLKVGHFGERFIQYGSEELFPVTADGSRDLSKTRKIIEVAERHGVRIGPNDETSRRALLEDIFEKGNVDRISELYHGVDLSKKEAQLAERIGAKGMQALGVPVHELLEGVYQHTNVALRAGQPHRGSFGRVAVRMRDLRMYAVGASAAGGEDVLSMIRKSSVMKTALERIGVKDAQAARSLRRYGMMWRNTVEVPTGLRSYMDAVVAAAEGRVDKLSSGEFEVISHEEYKKRFGSGLNKVPRRSELRELKGTPFVQEINGQLVPTRKTLVVKMGSEGVLPLERQMDTLGARTDHVVIPSGEAIGLRSDDLIHFSKKRGRGLKSGVGRMAVRLHGALAGGSDVAAYRASGATALIAGEDVLGRGGAIHRGGQRVRASFSGTLIADSTLGAGEVGISKGTLKEMLTRQGVTGAELQKKLTAIASGEEEFYTHFKTEPMRSTSHLTVARVKVLDDLAKVKTKTGTMAMASDEAIRFNPLHVLIRQRDFDYDPGYLFNLAKNYKRDAVSEYAREQIALRTLFQGQKAEQEAIGEVAQTIVATVKLKDAAKYKESTAELLAEARKIAQQMVGRDIKMGAMTTELAMAQTMAAGPELLTPLANVRWRTKVQLLEDVALGRNLDQMVLRNADSANSEALQSALEVLQKDRKATSWLHVLAETSEYQFLKKAGAEKTLRSLQEFAGSPDSLFSALTADLRTGAYRPGTAEANDVIERIQKPILDLISQAEGGNAKVWERLGTTPEQLAKRMATVFQAVSFLEQQGLASAWQSAMTDPARRGTAITGEGLIANYLKLVEGRSPELGERLVQNAYGWGGPLAGMAQAAHAAGDAAAANPKPAMGGFARGFVDATKKLWDSKWGKASIAGAGVVAALSLAKGVFGNADNDGPPGAPMPPPPMVDGLQPDRDLDYNGMPLDAQARIERVSQVRTHMQVSGRSPGRHTDFRGIANGSFGRLGRTPMHSGHFIDETHGLKDRARMEAEIHERLNSEF